MRYISEIKFCFIMPTFKGPMPSSFLTQTFWVLNDFCNLYFVIYWVVQAHLQRFRVFEVSDVMASSKIATCAAFILQLGPSPRVGWGKATDSSLYHKAKSFHGSGWSALLSIPAASTATLAFILGNFRAKPSVISTVLPASLGKMKSLASYKYIGDLHITLAIFRSLRMRVQISF